MRKENIRTLSIAHLKNGLLEMLKAKSYTEGTLNNYRRTLTILESYMYDNGIDSYTPVIGFIFIADYLSEHNLGSKWVTTCPTSTPRGKSGAWQEWDIRSRNRNKKLEIKEDRLIRK